MLLVMFFNCLCLNLHGGEGWWWLDEEEEEEGEDGWLVGVGGSGGGLLSSRFAPEKWTL